VLPLLAVACFFEGGPTVSLNKKSISYVPICLILNDKTMFVTQVKFDVLTRVVIQDSFAQVTLPNACSTNSVWFSNGCGWDAAGTFGPGIGKGAPTNFYASVQGVNSLYRKRYVGLSGTTVNSVFPIVTLVIQVDGGTVKSVYWDDDCYFNEGKTQNPSGFSMFSASSMRMSS